MHKKQGNLAPASESSPHVQPEGNPTRQRVDQVPHVPPQTNDKTMNNTIDHIAIGASSLPAGVAALKTTLGVEVPKGGKHEAMSTHNCVMQAGNESFIELIAVDPDAPDPGRVRWFTLDDATTITRLAERPRALCWVVQTDNLDEVVKNSPVDLGEVVNLTRGDLSWRLTVPKDGHLPENALLPAFIQWSPGPHPSTRQQDLGVRFNKVLLTHPDPDALKSMLTALNVDHLATVLKGDHVGLSFEVNSPNGVVILD